MPRFEDGVFQENILDNDLINKMVSFARIGAVPEYLLKFPIEITPVDDAANAIYNLIIHPNNQNRIFHLFNHNYVYVRKLLKLFDKSNNEITILQEEKFKSKIKEILQNEETKRLLKNILDDFDNDLHLDYSNDIIIKSKFTVRYLKKADFKWHKISDNYLNRFINLLRKVI